MLEFERDAEIIKGNDLKQSLSLEKNRCMEYIEKLNEEKKKTSRMQEQLGELNDEVLKIKEHLDNETKNFHLVWYH